jgi:hypothetical protein
MRSKTSLGARIGEFEKSLAEVADGLLDFADSRAEGFEDTASSRFVSSLAHFSIQSFQRSKSSSRVIWASQGKAQRL